MRNLRGTFTSVDSRTKATAARWLAMTSPNVTWTRSRCSSITVLSAWMSPIMRTICSCSSCSGLPPRLHARAQGILHEARVVEGADGIGVGHARRHHLAAAGIARHKVGLDQPGDDLEVGLHEEPVDLHRRAAGRRAAEVDMIGVAPRKVILHPHRGQDPRIADQLGQFVALVRAMEPGGDEHADFFPVDAGPEQLLDHRTQEEAIRHRPRDVADDDAGASFSPGEHPKRRGVDRILQRRVHRGEGIGQLGQRQLADDRLARAGRQLELQAAFAVGDFDGMGIWHSVSARFRGNDYRPDRPRRHANPRRPASRWGNFLTLTYRGARRRAAA